MSTAPIEPMLVLSTGHLTKDTCNSFLPGYLGPCFEKANDGDRYGWWVYVVEDDPDNEVPTDLRMCMELARSVNCCWIMFDRDAASVDGLPTFDW